MSNHSSFLLLITLWASVQDGLSLPVTKQAAGEAGDWIPMQHVRTKRCACSNMLDSECHYFCHLDIIWVNTPGKMAVYGLGNTRRKRSTGRCTCANPKDQTCTNFCHFQAEIKPLKRQRLDVASTPRAATERPMKAQDAQHSEGETPSEDEKKIV